MIKTVFAFITLLTLSICPVALGQFYWSSVDENFDAVILSLNEGDSAKMVKKLVDKNILSNLLLVGTDLWGVCSDKGGGVFSIFKFGTDGTNFEVIKEFKSIESGELGYRLSEHDGKIWGLTREGGKELLIGTIFSIDIGDYAYSSYDLDIIPNLGYIDDRGGLIFYDGKLWGLATTTVELGTLYSFDLSNGEFEGFVVGQRTISDVKLIDGSFWLTLVYGGTYGNGAIAKFDPVTKESITVHNFKIGNAPYGELTLANNKLWGVTKLGGILGNTFETWYGKGTLYSINLDGSNFEIVYEFDGEVIFPVGGLVAKDCKLWGIANSGENNEDHLANVPYIYSWDIETSTFTKENIVGPWYYSPRYYQTLTLVGDAGDCQYEKITGINQKQNRQVSFYPNPSQDKIILNTNFETPLLRYEILSMSGLPVQHGVIEGSMINISQLSPGIYLLLIKSNSGIYSSKLIKV